MNFVHNTIQHSTNTIQLTNLYTIRCTMEWFLEYSELYNSFQICCWEVYYYNCHFFVASVLSVFKVFFLFSDFCSSTVIYPSVIGICCNYCIFKCVYFIMSEKLSAIVLSYMASFSFFILCPSGDLHWGMKINFWLAQQIAVSGPFLSGGTFWDRLWWANS